MSDHTSHPLATESGLRAFGNILALQDIWYRLTKAQRRCLLSDDARNEHHVPIYKLQAKGLMNADLTLTEVGRAVVAMRPGKTA